MGFVNYVNGVPVSVEVGAGEEKFVKTLTNTSQDYTQTGIGKRKPSFYRTNIKP